VLANELATRFDLSFKRVSIRDQKTRWGSCSGTGAISLNWRIVLAPPETAEYIVIHELMHLKEMNHSPAFWGLVERACRRYKEHERWLDDHQTELNW
jgi:predicted metal-dependent hydrolase